jgi:hypothetical protein
MGWTGYHCGACHLVVEVGCDVYWDGTGCFSQVACRRCGTIHKIEHAAGGSDEFFAQSGPITNDLSDHDVLTMLGDWIALGTLPTVPIVQAEKVLPRRIAAVGWQSLVCGCCRAAGELATPDDAWPDDGVACPRCTTGQLEAVYVTVT